MYALNGQPASQYFDPSLEVGKSTIQRRLSALNFSCDRKQGNEPTLQSIEVGVAPTELGKHTAWWFHIWNCVLRPFSLLSPNLYILDISMSVSILVVA
ncbi:uncharacterized protein EI90DRAFT_3040653 [Cantharellus anzutake]|uniref:uncharacterized protein n=1 Tax=Cantharellus anzutake TaxID=1750568 RepID=UPI00190663B9|nr:uncharacterized protein EI90DRAFT_3040653 [Cantharellus anzutake]KAF8339155.1 hypothetical protein EI90DRAFT_3040653 [Cantharellus anzutake]